MAWGTKTEYYDQGEGGAQSKFNEAALQMQRLNKLQDRINDANLNPLLIHPEEKVYGFNIIFNNACSEFKEVSSKLKRKEELHGKILMNKIKKFMKENPVYQQKWDGGANDYQLFFSRENWEVLEKMLFNFELAVRKYLEDHKMTSPTEDDEGL